MSSRKKRLLTHQKAMKKNSAKQSKILKNLLEHMHAHKHAKYKDFKVCQRNAHSHTRTYV